MRGLWSNLWRRPVLMTFVAATLWAGLVVWASGFYRHAPEGEEHGIAVHLALGDGFRTPMDPSARAPATAWSPPVYPAVMAVAYRLFGGVTLGAVVTLAAVNCVCFGVVAAAVMRVALVEMSPRAGVLAVAGLCLNPVLLRHVANYWDAVVALAIFMTAVALAVSWGRRRLGLGRAALQGALLGVLSLTNAAYVLSYPVIVWAAAREEGVRRKVTCAVVALFAFLAVLTPWTLRNYLAFDRLFYVRGGVQLELWNGNLPDATGWQTPESFRRHPYLDPGERRLLLTMGEPAYFDLCGRRFRAEIAPGAFAWRSLRRAGYLLVGDPQTVTPLPFLWQRRVLGIQPDRLFMNGLAVLGLAGVWVAWRRRRARWVIVAAALAVAPYVVTGVADRYGLPLWVAFTLFGGLALATVTDREPPLPPDVRA